MSELREYLEFVRPWDDASYKVVTSQWKPADKPAKVMLKRGAQSIDTVISIIQHYDSRGENTWFSLQRFADSPARLAVGKGGWYRNVNRSVADVVETYCFYADLDVKAGAYSTLQEAVDAIYAFCVTYNLPPPSLLVCSGYGLHVYWRIDQPMTFQQWQPIANALKHAMQQAGIHADHGVTADAARILRPPGTRNWKDPANPQVTYIIPGSSKQVYPLEWFATPLRPMMGPHLATVSGKAVGPTPGVGGLNQNLIGGLNQQSPPVDLRAVAAECPTIANEFASAGAATSQPLWHLVALAAAYDPTPWPTFDAMSNGYPNYDPVAAKALLAVKEQNKTRVGWPSCAAFAAESPLCQACPHLATNGATKGPLHLKLLPTGATRSANIPSPYWQTADGVVMLQVPVSKDSKEMQDVRVLEGYPVRDGGIDVDTGDLMFTATIAGKDRIISVPASAGGGNTDIRKTLFAQGIHLFDKDILSKRAGEFIVAWLTHLQSTKVMHQKVRLGWNGSANFTFNDRTWVKGVDEKAAIADPKTCEHYGVKGSPQPWRDLVDGYVMPSHLSIQATLATAFAAPLVAVLGQSLMITFVGPSATGKSTGLRAAAGVWGSPTSTMSAVDDTANSVMKKISEVPNLPRYWDEVRGSDSLDKMVATAFRLGQGRDKDRLSQASQSMSGGIFSTVLVCAANTSIADIVTKKTAQTEAGALRVFEIETPRPPQGRGGTAKPTHLQAELDQNYGHIGEAYAKWLSMYKDTAKTALLAIQAKVEAQMGGKVEERLWHQSIAVMVAGAYFASNLGFAKFDYNALQAFLVGEAIKLRGSMKRDVEAASSPETLEEIIDEIIHGPNTIHTDGLASKGGRQTIQLSVGMGPDDVKRMKTPWAQWDSTGHVLRVTKRGFDQFLELRGQQSRMVLRELERLKAVVEIKSTIGAGVNMLNFGKTRANCLDIHLQPIQAATP